jgi:hypothetical protein
VSAEDNICDLGRFGSNNWLLGYECVASLQRIFRNYLSVAAARIDVIATDKKKDRVNKTRLSFSCAVRPNACSPI